MCFFTATAALAHVPRSTAELTASAPSCSSSKMVDGLMLNAVSAVTAAVAFARGQTRAPRVSGNGPRMLPRRKGVLGRTVARDKVCPRAANHVLGV